jgi:hypothetical protein
MKPKSDLLTLALIIVVASAGIAWGQGMEGPESGLSRLADDVLFSADMLATIIPVLAVMLLGAGIVFGLSLPPIIQVIAFGAILLLGPGAFTAIMGCELNVH